MIAQRIAPQIPAARYLAFDRGLDNALASIFRNVNDTQAVAGAAGGVERFHEPALGRLLEMNTWKVVPGFYPALLRFDLISIAARRSDA